MCTHKADKYESLHSAFIHYKPSSHGMVQPMFIVCLLNNFMKPHLATVSLDS